jgi:nucleotide-binding universal stress UspA family protein
MRETGRDAGHWPAREFERSYDVEVQAMYKRIFVALDGSRSARLALDEAIRIAAASGGMVTCAHVVEHRSQLIDVNEGFGDARENVQTATDAATLILDDAKETLALNHVSGNVRALDAYGDDVASVLMRTAAETDADLIVMGTSGRHGLRRLLVGSVAESLLRAADRPVLMVRHDEKVPMSS